jgi:hypothetical protein
MKRASAILLILVFVSGFMLMDAQAHMGRMMGGSQEQQYQQGGYGMGPGMMGGYGMGPGMMGGYGMGPGMMGGYGMGPGMMGGYGMGPGMMNVYNPQMKKFMDETKDLRRKLHMMKFEYSEALRDPKTTPETITKLQNEMRDLVIKLQQKAPISPYGGY